MARLNKQSLIEDLALHDAFAVSTKKEVTAVVDFILDYIQDAVTNGDEVNLAGFGKFTKFVRQNGQAKPKFTPFSAFKSAFTA